MQLRLQIRCTDEPFSLGSTQENVCQRRVWYGTSGFAREAAPPNGLRGDRPSDPTRYFLECAWGKFTTTVRGNWAFCGPDRKKGPRCMNHQKSAAKMYEPKTLFGQGDEEKWRDKSGARQLWVQVCTDPRNPIAGLGMVFPPQGKTTNDREATKETHWFSLSDTPHIRRNGVE